MKRVCILLFISLFCMSAFATGRRVVLLVSLDPKTNRPPLRSRTWNINQKLEKIFLKKLEKQKFELVVIPFVRQTELRRELLNPDNHAVFWVGHANRAEELTSASMYDDRGFNLKEVFQEVHQNINFLGLVGCRAAPFVRSLRKSGYWDLNTHLETYARERKTDARKGLKRAIKAFLKAKVKPAAACKEVQTFKVSVKRSSPTKMTAARILRKGQLIGTLAEGQTELIINLPTGLRKSDMKLVLESGATNNVTKNKFNMGRLEFDSQNPELTWKLFADLEGNPLGHGAHVYRFTGKYTSNLIKESILPSQCRTNN